MTLSETALRHIRERHPEVSRYVELIKDTVAKPDRVLKGRQRERKAVKRVANTHIGQKYLVVVYTEEETEKIIITAYFTSELKRIKGEVIWKA